MPDDTYFCEICGEAMPDQSSDSDFKVELNNGIGSIEKNENKFCFSCGAELGIEANFCSSCGKQQSPADSGKTTSRLPNADTSQKTLGEFNIAMYAHGANFLTVMNPENWGNLTVYNDHIEFNEHGVIGAHKTIIIQMDEIISVNMDTLSYILDIQKTVRIILHSGKDYVLVPMTKKFNEEADQLFSLIQVQIRQNKI